MIVTGTRVSANSTFVVNESSGLARTSSNDSELSTSSSVYCLDRHALPGDRAFHPSWSLLWLKVRSRKLNSCICVGSTVQQIVAIGELRRSRE